jgi:hypothetical protein
MKFKLRINYAELRKKAPVIVFKLSLIFWAFAYGVAVHKFHLFPFKIMQEAEKGAKKTFNTLTGKLPWYYRHTDRTVTVSLHRPKAFGEGLTLVSGLTKDGDIAVKVITHDGEVLHRWGIDWFDGFWPDPHHLPEEDIPSTRPATHIHGIVLLQNGDLVFNLEFLGLVRMDLCGKVVWRLPYRTHHALHVDEAGDIWVAGGERIKKRSPDLPPNHRPPTYEHAVLKVTPGGEIVREIPVFDVLIKNKLQGLLYMSAKANQSTVVSGDTLHLNDVEIFPPHLQPGVFERGDVLISLRNIHTIMVFNPDTLHVKYLSIGTMVRQHDPDFIDGNRISIFDNNHVAPESQGPQSRIVVVDARNDHMQVVYSGSAEQPFYTNIMGKHQWLPNGNLLITESTKGRAFEIDPAGQLVWEYFNVVDKGRLALLDEAQRLPPFFTPTFFEEGRRTCDKTQVAGASMRR